MRGYLVCNLIVMVLLGRQAIGAESAVVWWPLSGDGRCTTPDGPHGRVYRATFEAVDGSRAAKLDGQGAHILIPVHDSLRLATDDFTLCLWVHTPGESMDEFGDLISQFNPETRTGFHLSLRNHTGVTHSQPNFRQLQFCLDAGTEPVFMDEGRPGNAVFAQSMAVYDGQLYVGTCEPGRDEVGHVYRYEGPGHWIDCGAPDKANSVTSMAVWNGSLYIGTGKYRLSGSALVESENPHPGGRIFRYRRDGQWELVGHFPDMEAVGGMVVYGDNLYIGSLYRPAIFARYDGQGNWTRLPVPNGNRVEALGVFNGHLWATGYDQGHVYRFDGRQWMDMGQVGSDENTQTYAFAIYRGLLHVATWRSGRVFAWQEERWQDRGRLGEELEVMGMLVHNGCLYGGTLPRGQIYRYDGDHCWTLLRQLDNTPDVKYRRVWTMAAYQGKLFATTLPSGRVWSMRTGACISWDREFPAGWHHVAAQRHGDTLRLFVDGHLVVEASDTGASRLDLSVDQPWRIGAGSGDYFHGAIRDVRLYRRALSAEELRELVTP